MNVEEIIDLVFVENGVIKEEKKMVWWLQENLFVVKRDIKPYGRKVVKIRKAQEQSSFGTFENSVNFYHKKRNGQNFQETYVNFLVVNIGLISVMCQDGRRNPHIPFSCSKNPNNLERDDTSSMLTESMTGRIEAFSTYLWMDALNS